MEDSAKIYSPIVLSFYDFWVLKISNTFAWKCSTNNILHPFFLENISEKHMDIGVGSGFYVSKLPKEISLTRVI